jgi:hypothetical protein
MDNNGVNEKLSQHRDNEHALLKWVFRGFRHCSSGFGNCSTSVNFGSGISYVEVFKARQTIVNRCFVSELYLRIRWKLGKSSWNWSAWNPRICHWLKGVVAFILCEAFHNSQFQSTNPEHSPLCEIVRNRSSQLNFSALNIDEHLIPW